MSALKQDENSFQIPITLNKKTKLNIKSKKCLCKVISVKLLFPNAFVEQNVLLPLIVEACTMLAFLLIIIVFSFCFMLVLCESLRNVTDVDVKYKLTERICKVSRNCELKILSFCKQILSIFISFRAIQASQILNSVSQTDTHAVTMVTSSKNSRVFFITLLLINVLGPIVLNKIDVQGKNEKNVNTTKDTVDNCFFFK